MAFRTVTNPPYAFNTTGKQTNPTTSDVLADSGALPGAIYEVRVFVGCSVAATFVVQHRDAANSGNVGSVPVLRAAAGQTAEYVYTMAFNTNERVRVLPEANITGAAECAVEVTRIA